MNSLDAGLKARTTRTSLFSAAAVLPPEYAGSRRWSRPELLPV